MRSCRWQGLGQQLVAAGPTSRHLQACKLALGLLTQHTAAEQRAHRASNHDNGLCAARVLVHELGAVDDAPVVHKPGALPAVVLLHLQRRHSSEGLRSRSEDRPCSFMNLVPSMTCPLCTNHALSLLSCFSTCATLHISNSAASLAVKARLALNASPSVHQSRALPAVVLLHLQRLHGSGNRSQARECMHALRCPCGLLPGNRCTCKQCADSGAVCVAAPLTQRCHQIELVSKQSRWFRLAGQLH